MHHKLLPSWDLLAMMNQPFTEGHSDKAWIIEATCINCNKRFSTVRAVSMHLKATAARHSVSFSNHGNYKKTGLRNERYL
jgi:hypothetical protein